MEKPLTLFLKGVMSGLVVGIAGVVYLTVLITTGNKLLGALLFSFALLLIVAKNYALYTGRIGYLMPYKKGYLSHIAQVLLANIVGVAMMGLLVKLSGIELQSLLGQNIKLTDYANTILLAKLNFAWYQTFILSIFCGILMYVAVDGSKRIESEITKTLIIIGSVVIFLVAGFEHSIANMFYAFLGNVLSLKLLGYIIIMLAGNAIGGIAMNLIHTKMGEDLKE